ncbi:FUSC family protein [Sesbania bispinosa]|nr:FUSC family protein [Sesbania bispinosa]
MRHGDSATERNLSKEEEQHANKGRTEGETKTHEGDQWMVDDRSTTEGRRNEGETRATVTKAMAVCMSQARPWLIDEAATTAFQVSVEVVTVAPVVWRKRLDLDETHGSG